MGPITRRLRPARRAAFPLLLLAGIGTLAATPASAIGPDTETIQATYAQAGNTLTLTLVIYNYSSPSDLETLSQAFQAGHDRALATALSRTQAAGRCTINGEPSFDVAFIQMVLTPIGRKITFVTSRPHISDEIDPPASPGSFDLAVGEFDLNDTDNTQSTGFLYPARKLVVDKQGEFHYDLDDSAWPLVSVLSSKDSPA